MSPLQWTAALTMLAAASAAGAQRDVSIMQIQGSTARSPLEGKSVRTQGVVTLCTRKRLRCWIQDPRGDDDDTTSDGVALDLHGQQPGPDILRPGDLVRVTGRVRERQFGTGLPLTELARITRIQVLDRHRPLPPAVVVERLPDVSVIRAIAFWERLEGMRVQVDDAAVVGPTSRFGEFVVLARANTEPGSGYAPENSHLFVRPLADNQVDYNPERIIVDDEACTTPALRPGDRVHGLVGVVDYSFGNYKVQCAKLDSRAVHQVAERPPAAPSGVGLASFNLENFFDTERTPGKEDARSTPSAAAFETKLSKLALAVTRQLQSPAIIAVQEAENTAVLDLLAARINRLRHSAYRAVSFDSSDPRGIEVGLLWDSARITLQRAVQLRGGGTRAAFGAASLSPGREPLVGEFDHGGKRLTVVVNHFKSKAGDDPLFGRRQPPHRPTETQRKLQARAVRGYVDQLLQQNPRALVAVVGDFNDFGFAEPGEGADYPLAIVRGHGPLALQDLAERVPAAQRYSFIFEGNSQLLDHLLVSPALAALTAQVRIAHFNADYPAALHDDAGTPWRASDHDPIAAAFRIH